jgi:hypothetical protein
MISIISDKELYTQGLGVSYEVDFDTFKEFVNKIFKKFKIDRAPAAEDQDSDMSPDYINFSAPTKSTKKEGQKNQEGLLPEETNSDI